MSRQEFIAALDERGPHDCEGCGRFGAIYRQKLDQTVIRMLIKLYRVSKKRSGHAMDWVHVNDFSPPQNTRGRNFFMVKYWGLAEDKSVEPGEDKRASGTWRLTMDGIRFIRGQITVPKYKWIFDDTVLRDRQKNSIIYAIDCFKDKFSYQELIASILQEKD